MRGRIIVVSNRLPLSIVERDGVLVADRSIGGLATALSSVFAKYEPLWAGWTGIRRILGAEELKQLNLPESIVPVQAPAILIDRYYDRFSNRALWPTLHGLDYGFEPTSADWTAYQDMNVRFANVLEQVLKPDDLVWLHDFHLMLVPKLLRQKSIENRVGFFLHSPFPEPEHFLRLPHARELLESLADVDVLGLQTKRDVDEFWSLYTQEKLPYPPGLVRAFPIGVDYGMYHKARQKVAVVEQAEEIIHEAKGKHIILSISRLDHTKGILHQLKAVELFLKQQTRPHDYTYILVVAPSRESVPEYQDLKQAIAVEVKRINARLGNFRWKPIKYMYQNINFDQVTAHYLAADTLLLTPFMDGMNLIAKEYVATRADDKSMLVISGTMGAACQLSDAVIVDPLDTSTIAAGLQRAVAMSPEERTARWQKMRQNVQEEDVFWWADHFVSALDL